MPVRGDLYLNAGAIKAVMDRHTSLFSPGIVKVGGWLAYFQQHVEWWGALPQQQQEAGLTAARG